MDSTELLIAHTRGDSKAVDTLLPRIYDELREIAEHLMLGERRNHTLQPTALIHEAYVRMIEVDRMDWKGMTHFKSMAVGQMRRLLINSAEAAKAKKRGAGWDRVTIDEGLFSKRCEELGLVDLLDALDALAKKHLRPAQVANLRLVGGLSVKEVAYRLNISQRTVFLDWRFARASLMREFDLRESSL